jgi:hypothetical protein
MRWWPISNTSNSDYFMLARGTHIEIWRNADARPGIIGPSFGGRSHRYRVCGEDPMVVKDRAFRQRPRGVD